MDSATFSGGLIVIFGVLAGATFGMASRQRTDLPRLQRLLWLMTAGVALYCAVLWGGVLASWWPNITPVYGRPALALTLAALAWGGLFHARTNGSGRGR